jgi:hypothetical protein
MGDPTPIDPSPALSSLLGTVGWALGQPAGGAQVARALVEFGRSRGAWETAVQFRSGGYSRHLLHRSPHFEVLLLCWDRGLESDLHDHAGQRCWMTALDGQIEELRFRRGGGGRVEQEGARRLEPDRPAFITDELGLHVIRAAAGQQAVSLHLYARPVPSCGIYCSRTGRNLGQRELRVDSVRPGAVDHSFPAEA